jgi:hemolysin III
MSPVSLVAGLTLVTLADKLRGRITLGIFTLAAVTLFTCSALYHRVNWTPKTKAVWRRIDHANIPLLIAGTYTPFAIFLLKKNDSILLLSLVWGGAILTALMRISWISAPRWLYVPLYLALGWAAVIYLPEFWTKGGVAVFLLILIGGLC